MFYIYPGYILPANFVAELHPRCLASGYSLVCYTRYICRLFIYSFALGVIPGSIVAHLSYLKFSDFQHPSRPQTTPVTSSTTTTTTGTVPGTRESISAELAAVLRQYDTGMEGDILSQSMSDQLQVRTNVT